MKVKNVLTLRHRIETTMAADMFSLSIACAVFFLILALFAVVRCFHRKGCHYCKEERESGIYTTICLDDDELEEFMDRDYD